MPTEQKEPVPVRGPAALVSMVPSLLGYVPISSMVLIPLKDRTVQVVARVDLPPVHDEVPSSAVVDAMEPVIARCQPDTVLLLVYPKFPGEADAAMEAVTRRMHELRVPIRDRIVVTPVSWRSLDCKDPECCPPEGTPLLEDSSAAEELRIRTGKDFPAESREVLASQVAEDVNRVRTIGPLPEGGVDLDYCRGTIPYWAYLARNEEPPSSAMVERMALACTDVLFRDGIVSALCHTVPMSMFEPDMQEVLRPLLAIDPDPWTLRQAAVAFAGAVPTQPESAQLLAVLTQFAFMAGDFTVANMLIDRTLKCDPEHRLSRQTAYLISKAVKPDRLRIVGAGVAAL
jgi:hypothetical protein